MPNVPSTKKSLKQNKTKNLRNRTRMSALRTQIKKLSTLIDEKSVETIDVQLSLTVKLIDKAASKGLLKKNTASRRKSRLMKLVNVVKAA